MLELENINLKVCLSGAGCRDCICTEFLLAIFPILEIQILLWGVFKSLFCPFLMVSFWVIVYLAFVVHKNNLAPALDKSDIK